MKKWILILSTLVTACGGTPSQSAAPTATVPSSPTIVAVNGYRPIQTGDIVEGATIAYQYVLPSLDAPVVDIAFSSNLLQIVSVNPDLMDSFLEYVREIAKTSAPVLAYDETIPNQTEPKAVTFDPARPVEIVFVQMTRGAHYWSVTETDGSEVQAAYKIVRRKDGGLRLIDAYALGAINSANLLLTMKGGGTGLVFSSRLALLKLILADARYQSGTNVFESYPVTLSQYDARILKIDPTREGIAQNRDWFLISRPAPAPGGLPSQ